MGSIIGGFMLGSFLSGRYAARFPLTTIISGRVIACFGLALDLALFLAGVDHVMALFGSCMFIGVGNGLTMPSVHSGALLTEDNAVYALLLIMLSSLLIALLAAWYVRGPLHPLGQFRAFQAMLEKGMIEEEIAGAFLVDVKVVKQRQCWKWSELLARRYTTNSTGSNPNMPRRTNRPTSQRRHVSKFAIMRLR